MPILHPSATTKGIDMKRTQRKCKPILTLGLLLLCGLIQLSCQKDSLGVFEITPLDPTNEEDNSEESKAVAANAEDILGAWNLVRYLVNGDNKVDDYAEMRIVLTENGDAVVVQENSQFIGKWRLTNKSQSLSIFMTTEVADAQIWYKEWLIMAIGKTELDLLNITENRQLRMELSRIPEIPIY